jgi:ribonuclease BN (tRNA processing enzyme)
VDHDILIDAGTGVGDLTLAELAQIDHVFITHSHLDHIACIPFMVDTVGDMRSRPLTLHATGATLEIIKAHVFNWAVWPDFSEIPSADKPFMCYEALQVGQSIEFGARRIRVLPANHTVPAVGYALDSGDSTLVFTGDTTVSDELWRAVNKIRNLRYLIVETAFSNRERQLAIASKHLCPSMLAEELQKLQHKPEIFITHMKPGQIELTMQEIAEEIGEFKPRLLQNNHVFEF